jgi:hypothetical protein
MRDTMQRHFSMQIISKNTDGSLPEMQIGANNTKRPQMTQMTQMTQSDKEEAQIDTESSRERSARLITCWRYKTPARTEDPDIKRMT